LYSLFIEIGYYYKLDIYHLYRRCLVALFLFRIACIFSHLGLVFEFYSTYAKISFLHILKLNSSCTFCTTEIDSWHLHILLLLDLISVDCTFCHLWYKYIYIAWTFFFTFEMFHLFVHIYYTTYYFSLVLHISSHLKLHCISTSETDICKVVHLIIFHFKFVCTSDLHLDY
jgi:hypothetical protein